jgi:hypothetical protein
MYRLSLSVLSCGVFDSSEPINGGDVRFVWHVADEDSEVISQKSNSCGTVRH